MATQDYTSVASSYKAKFAGQSRSQASAAVTSNEQFDRDNLLHFIEDNFKTNVKGGLTMENLRTFLHVLVKSSRIQNDDNSLGVLHSNSFSISSTGSSYHYFGNSTYGYNHYYWSQRISTTLSSTVLPSLIGSYGNMGVDCPFDISKFSCSGSISNTTSTGIVKVRFYYSDNDNDSSSKLGNMTYIGMSEVNCAVTDTNYNWSISTTTPIPAGKKIFMFIQNEGWTSGIEHIKATITMSHQTLSSNWTI